MFNTAREILVIVGALAGVISTTIPLIIKLIKKSKQFKQERNLNRSADVLLRLIAEAELFTNYSGQEKKEFVKSRLAIFAINNKIAFDEARLETAIDDIIGITREVNKRDKDKQLYIQDNQYSYRSSNLQNHFGFTKIN